MSGASSRRHIEQEQDSKRTYRKTGEFLISQIRLIFEICDKG